MLQQKLNRGDGRQVEVGCGWNAPPQMFHTTLFASASSIIFHTLLGFPPCIFLQHCASQGTSRACWNGKTKRVRGARMGDTRSGELFEDWSRLWNLTFPFFTSHSCLGYTGGMVFLKLNQNPRSDLPWRWLWNLEFVVVRVEEQNYRGLLTVCGWAKQSRQVVLWLWQLWL